MPLVVQSVGSEIVRLGESVVPSGDDDVRLVGDDRLERHVTLGALVQTVDGVGAVLGIEDVPVPIRRTHRGDLFARPGTQRHGDDAAVIDVEPFGLLGIGDLLATVGHGDFAGVLGGVVALGSGPTAAGGESHGQTGGHDDG